MRNNNNNEKLIRKWTKSVFFRFFSILWVREWSRFVWPNLFELFVTGLQTDLVPKSANGFRTRCNYYYIWPMTLLELKYIMTSARNAAAIAKGMVELRSIVFYSREERGRWRQGPRCLRCSKLRRIGGLGGLMMTPRRSSGCGACILELTTRRHRGRSQAPWTIVMLVRKPSQSIHTSRETYVSPAVPHAVCLFVASSPCWRHSRSGIIICTK